MDIPDEDSMFRLVFDPFMRGKDRVFNELVFTFQERNGVRKESLVWSRHASTPLMIHELGVKKETSARKEQHDQTYVGYISAIVGAIRRVNADGHGFMLIHEPEEGDHHVGIKFSPDLPDKKDKHLRNRLRTLLRACFSNLESWPTAVASTEDT